ncbi:MAG: hypothetical protein ABS82_00065 [Rhodanobacter sp. SCN 67-45]|nr:MAG: hypothetical protein ABS82_00065 [Rhodanobacter sp. SCN 67-45]
MAYPTVNGVPLDQIFDPYVSGTKAAITGYTVMIAGVATDLRDLFAPIYLGSSAAPTKYKVNNADLNTIFAAKGTAQYALPINGQTFTSSINITSGSGNATIGFRIVGGNQWQVYKINSASSATVLASGAVPTNASTVKYTWGVYAIGVGQTDAGGSTSNGAATAQPVVNNPTAAYTTATNTSTSGSKDRRYPFTIDFYSAAGQNISHTSITLIGDTEGSI